MDREYPLGFKFLTWLLHCIDMYDKVNDARRHTFHMLFELYESVFSIVVHTAQDNCELLLSL